MAELERKFTISFNLLRKSKYSAVNFRMVSGSSYAPLTNSPLPSSSLAAVPTTSPQPHLVQPGGGSQQFVSYNGDTYLIQTSPNGTHQLVATLNGRSITPNQATSASTGTTSASANMVTLEKPFNNNEASVVDSNNTTQICEFGF